MRAYRGVGEQVFGGQSAHEIDKEEIRSGLVLVAFLTMEDQ